MKRVMKLIAIGFLLVGCELTQSPQDFNQAPLVDAGANKVTTINTSITITATASDVDGQVISYRWRENDGTLVGSEKSFVYKASSLGNHTLTLTVTDDFGKIARDFMLVTVTNSDGSLNGEIIPSTQNTPTPSSGGSTGSTGGSGTTSNSSIYSVQKLGSAINIDTTITVGTKPKNVYLVLSNGSTSSYVPTISNSVIKSARAVERVQSINNILPTSPIIHHPSYVEEFNNNVDYYLNLAQQNSSNKKIVPDAKKQKDTVGNSQSFYLSDTNFFNTTTATARKVVSSVVTNNGLRTLNIWVSNDSFGVGCSKKKCVTQTMVDALANTFLKSGDSNDIYDLVTNIYGKEWGTVSGMIGESREITILLTDIDKDNNPNGGVIGFYWSKDNFPKSILSIRASNERLMFYIDSVMFANDLGQTWTIDSYWAKETLSTLTHEFQHMISFYQKKILLKTSNNTWLDELVSETTEDLIATKIKYNGPRNVVYTDGSAGNSGNSKGRYPRFNINNDKSITSWNGQLYDYSKVSAFGTFLIRNYGGAKLMANIQKEKFPDERAIVNAVRKDVNGANKTFTNLLNEWGVAMLLSDNTNVTDVPKYNTGDFINSTFNGVTYEMGSINFFNYTSQPKINTTTGTINSNANYFYKIGSNVTGNISLSLRLNGQTEATVVVK